MQRKSPITHETFIAEVARLAIANLTTEEDKAAFAGMKLTYGMGQDGIRGITYYNRWKAGEEPTAFVEIGATCQRDWIQVAGTTIHELGHVLAGWKAAHGKDWHNACDKLGLRCIKAAGTDYQLAHFKPELRNAIALLGKPDDGEPVCSVTGRNGKPIALKPCTAGIGTRGGKSRGAGSGSRLRLFECECMPAVKVRVARDEFAATCDCCHAHFHRA